MIAAKLDPLRVVIERDTDFADAISYFLACAMLDRRPPPFSFIRRGIDLEPTGHLMPARLVINLGEDADFLAEAHGLAEAIGMQLVFEENLRESSETDGRYILRDRP